MKKSALSLSLLLGLIAGCMTGCSEVKTKKVDGSNVIFTIGNETVTADDILGFADEKLSYDFLKTDDGVKTVYEAIYNAIAQKNVKITTTIEGAVKERMKEWDESVESYASSNGVTTRNAEKTKLEELGYEDRNELEQSYYIQEQKEELENQYSNKNMEPDLASMSGKSMVEKYVTNTAPMIVKHILVKVSDNSTIYNLGEITSTEVDKAASVMQRLALGKATRNSFKNIAIEESEDSTNTKGGNLGIMDTYTSFVSEFKLGLYVNEKIQNKDKADFDANDTLGMKAFEEELFGTNGIYADYKVKTINVASVGAVLSYVKDEQAKDEQTAAGHTKTSEYDADLYPRNIIYNHYFNYTGIQYLVLDLTNAEAEIKALLKEVFPSMAEADINTKAAEVMASEYYTALTNAANQNVDENGYVLDDNGKPITLAKSTYGFHFLSTTWSALNTSSEDAIKYFVYNQKVDDSVTTYVEDTQFNFGYSTTTVAKNTRKSEIKDRVINYVKGGFGSEVSTSDNLYNFDIYEYYIGISDITINSEALEKAVNDYISTQRELKAVAIEEAATSTWESYIETIEACNEMHELLYK